MEDKPGAKPAIVSGGETTPRRTELPPEGMTLKLSANLDFALVNLFTSGEPKTIDALRAVKKENLSLITITPLVESEAYCVEIVTRRSALSVIIPKSHLSFGPTLKE